MSKYIILIKESVRYRSEVDEWKVFKFKNRIFFDTLSDVHLEEALASAYYQKGKEKVKLVKTINFDLSPTINIVE